MIVLVAQIYGYSDIYAEKQIALGQHFDQIHSVARAKQVGSIDEIIAPQQLRPYLIQCLKDSMAAYLESR